MAPTLRELPGLARSSTRAAALVGWTAGMLAAVESHKLVDRELGSGARQEQIFDRYMRTWTGVILRVLGIDLRIVGTLPPAPTGARMVVSNHRAAIDIPILLTHFGGSVLSRGDLEHWPLLGLAAQKAQTIFVDREDSRSGAHAIRAIREQLQRGRTISIFPEGTTFAGDEVREFIPGAFAACRKLDVEFVPVGLAYPPGTEFTGDSFLAHTGEFASRSRTPVAMAVGEPVRLEGRAAKLATQLHERVAELVPRARAALG